MKLWPLGLYRVKGGSMEPELLPGDLILGWRWFQPRVGQVVVIRELELEWLIKRITNIHGGAVWVAGDNTVASTDSRHFGPISRDQIVARVVKRWRA